MLNSPPESNMEKRKTIYFAKTNNWCQIIIFIDLVLCYKRSNVMIFCNFYCTNKSKTYPLIDYFCLMILRKSVNKTYTNTLNYKGV